MASSTESETNTSEQPLCSTSSKSDRPSTSGSYRSSRNGRPSTGTRPGSARSAMTNLDTLVNSTRNASIVQQSPPRRASLAFAQSITLPRTWNAEMDRLICRLDAQDAGLEVMFNELKKRFPDELGKLVVAKEAIARRLELLEWRPDWDGWKAALDLGNVGMENVAIGHAEPLQEQATSSTAGQADQMRIAGKGKENERDRLANVVRKYENPVGASDDYREVENGIRFPLPPKSPAKGKAADLDCKAQPNSADSDPFYAYGSQRRKRVIPESALRSLESGSSRGM